MNPWTSVSRRGFLASSTAAVLGTSLGPLSAWADAKRSPRILLRSSWQTVNIGDIGHTPGILALLERHLSEAEVTLWAAGVNAEVEAMLRRRFPKVSIIVGGRIDAKGNPNTEELRAAFERMDLFLHGSGPYVVSPEGLALSRRMGKPYGVYGVSIVEVNDDMVGLLSGAAFVFCRDTDSLAYLKRRGVKCPVMKFGPDAAFGIDCRDEERAAAFMKAHELEDRRFICAVPRLRYTPYHKMHKVSTDPAEIQRREAVNEQFAEADHGKLREVIAAWVRETGLKALVCPEMTYEMEIGRRLLVDPLPDDVKRRVVHRDSFWLPDEAGSVYARAHTVVSIEMHSPIIALAAGTPTLHLRQPTDGRKGQMMRDIRLADWLFELDASTGRQIADALLKIHADYPAAQEKLKNAMSFVRQHQAETMAVVAKAVRAA